MRFRRASTFSVSMTALAAFMSFAAESRADTSCTADSECPKGFTCQVTGESGCAAPACAPGADCPPAPPCDQQVYKSCELGPCSADSDCATGMVCHSTQYTECSESNAPACPPDQKCDPLPSQPTCTTATTSACTPKYDLPCNTAADCGDGFNCIASQSCECSGGGGAADASTGSASSGSSGSSNPSTPTPAPSGSGSDKPAPAPLPPDCTCTPSAILHCEAKSIECKTDAACPAGWSCVTPPVATPGCAEPLPAREGDAGAPVPVCDPPPTTPAVSYCMPPYYAVDQGNAGAGSPETGGTLAVDGGAIAPVSDPGTPKSGGSAPTGSAGSTSAEHSSDDTSAKSDGGCEVAPGNHSASGAAVFSLLGLLAAVRRRRRAV